MQPIVCWDFDETLGYFRPLELRFLGAEVPKGMPPPRLKPGISELLVSLSEFTHVVTTAAVAEYAREVLREQGILNLFAAVIGREEHQAFSDPMNAPNFFTTNRPWTLGESLEIRNFVPRNKNCNA